MRNVGAAFAEIYLRMTWTITQWHASAVSGYFNDFDLEGLESIVNSRSMTRS